MSYEDEFDMSTTPEEQQEYKNAADRTLTAPTKDENPTFNQGKEPGLGTWTEVVKIRDTDIKPTKGAPNDKTKLVFWLTFEILGPDQGGFITNAGRTHTDYPYIDKVAMKSGEKAAGIYKRRMAVIDTLLSAAGADIGGGVPSYAALLKGDKPLVGQTVAAVVRKYRNNKTNENEVAFDGFVAFSPEGVNG